MKDVAYLLASSVDEDVVAQHEGQLLDHYHATLLKHLAAAAHAGGSSGSGSAGSSSDRGGGSSAASAAAGPAACSGYTREVMQRHYELCLLDYVRFMAGWGFWGNVSWASNRARAALRRLPQLLKEQERQRTHEQGW